MPCYRSGGCGPYEMRSCSECPASNPEYAQRGDPEMSKVSLGSFPTVGSPEGYSVSKEESSGMRAFYTNSVDCTVECGGSLVERRGRYGTFLGCSN